jgi:hypothetical protein
MYIFIYTFYIWVFMNIIHKYVCLYIFMRHVKIIQYMFKMYNNKIKVICISISSNIYHFCVLINFRFSWLFWKISYIFVAFSILLYYRTLEVIPSNCILIPIITSFSTPLSTNRKTHATCFWHRVLYHSSQNLGGKFLVQPPCCLGMAFKVMPSEIYLHCHRGKKYHLRKKHWHDISKDELWCLKKFPSHNFF